MTPFSFTSVPLIDVPTKDLQRTSAEPLPEFVSAPGLAVPGAMNQAGQVGDAIANDAAAQQQFAEARAAQASAAAAQEAARLQALVDAFLESVRFYVDAETVARERYAIEQARADAAFKAYQDSWEWASEDSLVRQEPQIPKRYDEAYVRTSSATVRVDFTTWLEKLISHGSAAARTFREYLRAHELADHRRADIASLDAGQGAPNYSEGATETQRSDLQRGWSAWRKTHPASNTAPNTAKAGDGGLIVVLALIAKVLFF